MIKNHEHKDEKNERIPAGGFGVVSGDLRFRKKQTVRIAVGSASAGKRSSTYQLEIDGNSLVFYKGKKEVARVTIRAEEEQKKIEATSVSVEQNQLKAIELAGTKTRLIVE